MTSSSYNVLGLEKGHIARVVAVETILSTAVSITVGLIIGGLFGQLNFWILNYILELPQEFTYGIESSSLIITTGLFIGIFFIAYLYNLANIQFSNPIELLKGGNKGEKEPKSKWILFLIGLVSLGAGYHISLSINDPIQAIMNFFLAVLLVIVGTYLLFNAGSIIFLKYLKKRKSFYYKPGPFISISGMLYRMKQHATGLANICLLSVMVIIAVSTTAALYVGLEDTLNLMFPRENILTISNTENETEEVFEPIVQGFEEDIEMQTSEAGLSIEEFDLIRRASFYGSIRNGEFVYGGMYFTTEYDSEEEMPSEIVLFPLEDYNELTGNAVSLEDNELLIYAENEELEDSLIIGEKEYVVEEMAEIPELIRSELSATSRMAFVLPSIESIQEVIDTINAEYLEEQGGFSQSNPADSDTYSGFHEYISYEMIWSTDGSTEEKEAFGESFQEQVQNQGYGHYSNYQLLRSEYLEIIGGFLFLGVYLGSLFIIGTVLITYFKQISEGFDDREKIQAMQKVGLDKATTRKATHSQVVWMFILPLVVAVIHTSFAYPILYSMINVLGRITHPLLLLSIGVVVLSFSVIYGIIYHVTSKVYLKIVE